MKYRSVPNRCHDNSMCARQAADAASRLAEGENPDVAQLPPGTVEFNVPPPQLTAALAEDSLAVDSAPDIDVPDALLPPERLDELLAERQPAYVPLPGTAEVLGLSTAECCCIVHEHIKRLANWLLLEVAVVVLMDTFWAHRDPHPQVDNTPDTATGVVRLQLSNGIKVNYRRTDNEPQAAMIRMVAAGGRACEGVSYQP